VTGFFHPKSVDHFPQHISSIPRRESSVCYDGFDSGPFMAGAMKSRMLCVMKPDVSVWTAKNVNDILTVGQKIH
jgi:hypothetical protein